MKNRVNDFIDQFPDFHSWDATDQIVALSYFHTVQEGRESISREQLEHLFRLVDTPIPKSLRRLLAYLCTDGAKLIENGGEFTVRREVRKRIENDLAARGEGVTEHHSPSGSYFDFGTRRFSDQKIAALLGELRTCYLNACWNASGILIRIIIERTLDSASPVAKEKTGLRDKINSCKGSPALSKSVREGLDHLLGAKLIGDIVAHHSRIILEKADIDLVLPTFRMLVKEVTTI